MRRGSFVVLSAVLLVLSVLVVFLQAGDKQEMMKSETIEGTLVDSKCYAMGGFLTNDHMNMKGDKMPSCATACASMGLPVALVTADKKVHILAVPAKEYAQWMAMELRLTGMQGKNADVFIPEKLEVKENGNWVAKDLPGTMM